MTRKNEVRNSFLNLIKECKTPPKSNLDDKPLLRWRSKNTLGEYEQKIFQEILFDLVTEGILFQDSKGYGLTEEGFKSIHS